MTPKVILKRDGREAVFDTQRIVKAITKAVKASNAKVEPQVVEETAQKVAEELSVKDRPTVEECQDLVEKHLMLRGLTDVAKEYIIYREKRSRVRERDTVLMKTIGDITLKDSSEMDLKRENANIDSDTSMGTMLRYGSETSKRFYLLNMISERFAEAHKQGDIHIHDMDFAGIGTATCCYIDLGELFKKPFSTGHGTIRPPKTIRSMAALTCIVIQSNQNEQHGGQAVPQFDRYLAEGVRRSYNKTLLKNIIRLAELLDAQPLTIAAITGTERPTLSSSKEQEVAYISEVTNLLGATHRRTVERVVKDSKDDVRDETYQAMEALVHNLNSMHSRAGAQVPFSSINYGTDISEEGRLVIKGILKALDEGLGGHETPIFPIHVFKVKDGVSGKPGDKNYDLYQEACRITGRRLYPNLLFLDAPHNLQFYNPNDPDTEVSAMGCRTRTIGNVYDPTRQVSVRRGNLSFTTINLPRLAIKADHDIERFFRLLDEMLELSVDQITERFGIQANKRVKNFPFLMGQGLWMDSEKLKSNDKIGEVLKHGTLSIGFIGLAETLTALIGKHHGESKEAQQLGLQIVSHMREYLDRVSQERKMNYTCLATPAEGLSGRFTKMDREKYGVIPGVTDREYYTNSFHVPVHHPISIFDKIDIEAPYHTLTNGGHISYVELDGDLSQNPEAVMEIAQYMKKAGIGYGSINHPVDEDHECGYIGIIGDECPKCHRVETPNEPFTRIRRVTGYLGYLDKFNDAKRAEEASRLKHNRTPYTE